MGSRKADRLENLLCEPVSEALVPTDQELLTKFASTIRFVDCDMFMRYRGGGVGHKYMRDIEKKYEEMSLERTHGGPHQKPPQADPAEPADGVRRGGDVLDESRLDENESDDGNGPEVTDGGVLDTDGDESVDSDYAPSTLAADDSDGDSEWEDYMDDSDEIGSAGGYESYGLADP